MTVPTHQGAIITGGASGLGLSIANDLLSKNWRVIVADVNKTGKSVVDELLAKYGPEVALWVQADISDWNQQAVMFDKAFTWCPNITLLAANAGITTNLGAPNSITADAIDGEIEPLDLRVIDVNVRGTINSIKLFQSHVRKQGRTTAEGGISARVIVTGSEGGLYALPADPIYAASKHALIGLVRSLGPIYKEHFGITVNSINPGCIPTPLVAPLLPITPTKYFTPLAAVVRAFMELLDGDMTGQTIECSGEKAYYQQQQAYPDEVATDLWDGTVAAMWTSALAEIGAKQ